MAHAGNVDLEVDDEGVKAKLSHGLWVTTYKSRVCGEKGMTQVEEHSFKFGKSKISKTDRNGIPKGVEGKSE